MNALYIMQFLPFFCNDALVCYYFLARHVILQKRHFYYDEVLKIKHIKT